MVSKWSVGILTQVRKKVKHFIERGTRVLRVGHGRDARATYTSRNFARCCGSGNMQDSCFPKTR